MDIEPFLAKNSYNTGVYQDSTVQYMTCTPVQYSTVHDMRMHMYRYMLAQLGLRGPPGPLLAPGTTQFSHILII